MPYTASNVAKYFVKKSYEKKFDEGLIDGVTNLKLQKLLYFAQAAKLVRDKEPLFNESILAWKYGPVVGELYHELKKYGSDIIPEDYAADMSDISKDDQVILDQIWNKLSEASASRLVEITHRHAPWKDAFEKEEGSEIPLDSMSSFYERIFSVVDAENA